MNFTTPLREITCHVGSHSVTCHPAAVTFPPLPQPKPVLNLATRALARTVYNLVKLLNHQCDFRFDLFLVLVLVFQLFFSFSFVLVFIIFFVSFSFANYFLVLVSFQFYSIGDFHKHVMICLNTVHS